MRTRTYEPWQDKHEATVFWHLAAAYIADVVGLLDQEQASRLDELSKQYEQNWRYHVAKKLQTDDDDVRKIYDQCLQHRTSTEALELILHGAGCPDASEHLRDVLGQAHSS